MRYQSVVIIIDMLCVGRPVVMSASNVSIINKHPAEKAIALKIISAHNEFLL